VAEKNDNKVQKKSSVKDADLSEDKTVPIITEVQHNKSFPIVGIGASAGGLAAFEDFFSGMPIDKNPDMAFILVQHLDPNHKSILTEIIQRYTSMQVFEVEDGMVVHPNCTYIIPPGHDMAFIDGTLQLLEPTAPRGQRLPIDFFFRSLAIDQHERAICIVLSGTGSDGTLGVRAIKGEGGMAMAQTPDSTEFDGMPRSAIATGMVDYELAPSAMPAQLIAYATHAFGKVHHASALSAPNIENALKKIFILLRAQTGHDFSLYKVSTIHRRIERRMAVNQIKAIEDYVKYLQQSNPEVDALFRDVLIGVTNFFRDPEAFKIIEDQVIPNIFANKRASDVIRIWSPGCSTGEEAYSLAILLAERQEAMKQYFKVQVFATDIDSQAIATARMGIYPASIASDVSPERLARFFIADPNGETYRIHKHIRDMLIFSEQDVIKDPPFSKLDIISCRNMMIYMGGDLQKKLIPLFYYALKQNGCLFLGTSETVGDFSDLFSIVDRKSKVYKRRDDIYNTQRFSASKILPAMSAIDVAVPKDVPKNIGIKKLPLRELTEQSLIQQVVQAAVLVDSKGDIFYLHGRTGMYLEPAQGEVGVNNIFKMAREGLQRELTVALHKVVESKEILSSPGIRVKTNSHFTLVNMVIRPVDTNNLFISSDEPLYLVILEQAANQQVALVIDSNSNDFMNPPETKTDILALKEELLAKEEYLHATNEELETANEELKSSNEEMQSVNEELQSTNEELETSKEELQSINEELATVNSELQTKVGDLSRVNNDMNNLLAGTGIATIFVDYRMCILRFTPFATQIINLILSDLGRPVSHIVSNLVGYANLIPDIQTVLDTLIPKDIEVQTLDEKWYTMYIKPYRTLDNVIEGAVITFVDITEIKYIRESLRKANEMARLAVVVRDSYDAITVQDMDGRIIAWNPGAVRMYGWKETEALVMNVKDRIPKNHNKEELTLISQLAKSKILEPYQTQRITKDGSVVDVWLTATALVNETGEIYAIATTERTNINSEG
jgi:two-component system CheB/CheR fusion protein